MTNQQQQHQITPPPELMQRLHKEAPHGIRDAGVTRELCLIDSAYRAGADQELEACCEWLRSKDILEPAIDALRIARRPKPPSLKEVALEDLRSIELLHKEHKMVACTFNIRRVLEALPND